jgi:hypothetical protein
MRLNPYIAMSEANRAALSGSETLREVKPMNMIANAADRLLGIVVPRARAAAWSCPPGCHRVTCSCQVTNDGAYWFDQCQDNYGENCLVTCQQTVWTC